MTDDPARKAKPRWDLCDEDGDYHSPVWYLDAYMTTREVYLLAHGKDISGQSKEDQDRHLGILDDLLNEMEMYENYVNRLFGYSDE